MMIGQCLFTDCNKCPTSVPDVDSGEDCAYVGAGGVWELSVSSAQLRCEPITALKMQRICIFTDLLFPH